MANTQSWGGGVTSTYFSSWSGNVVYRDNTGPIPTANVAFNGNRPLTIHSCSAVSLSNGSPEVVYQGLAWSPGRTFASSTPGGGFRFQVRNTGGTMSVGRSEPDGGTIVDAGDGDTRVGSIPGSFTWSGVPTAPRTLTATAHATTAGRIDLAWVAPSNDGGTSVTGYNVYDGSGTLIASLGNVLSYSHTGLTGGSTYNYVVRAKNATATAASTTSVNSNSASAVAKALPSAPRSLSATANTSVAGRVDLSWTVPSAPAGTITGYTVFRDGSQIATTSGTGTTYAATGLSPGTSYDFTVRARNAFADSNSTYSAASNTATATPVSKPDAPTIGTLVQLSSTSARVTWTAPAFNGGTAITGYRITYASNSVFSGATVLDVGVSTQRDLVDLTPGFQYWVKVQARNNVGPSNYSATLSVLIVAAIGDLNGWASFGTLTSGLSYLVSGGLRRAGLSNVSGAPVGLIREVRSTTSSGGPSTTNTLGIQRTVTTEIGKTYRLNAKAVSMVDTTPPGNTYRWNVPGVGSGSTVTTSNSSTVVTVPAYTFVATATSHVIQLQLSEAASWSSMDWFENVGFYAIRLYEIPNTSIYRLQDTVYEGPLSNHYTYACDTIGAAWWVDANNVTQFRQTAEDESTIKAVFSDVRGMGKSEYVGVQASFGGRSLVNALTLNNHGRKEDLPSNPGTYVADDTKTVHSSASSQTAWGVRSAAMDITMRRSAVYDATNLATDPEFAFNATPPGFAVVSPGGGTYAFSRITSATNGTPYAGQISATTASSSASAFRIQALTTGLVAGDPFTLSFLVWSSVPMTDLRARVYAYQNADGSGTSYTFNGTATAVSSTATLLTVSGTMPASTLSARAAILVNSPLATSQTLRFDNVMLTKTATPVEFFDGVTAESVDYAYSWSGTAHASTSVRARWLTSYRAAEVFDANGTPSQTISSIRWNAQEDPTLAATLDIQDRVRVEFQGTIQDSRIIGKKDDFTGGRWMMTLLLAKG